MSKAAQLAALIGSGQAQGDKNLIINGGMAVAQRGTSQTGITGGGYKKAPDRYNFNVETAGTWTVSQSTTAPEGFSNSYKVECTTADASLAASDVVRLRQRIEGQNLQQLKKGTSNAESVTLSFYVRSSKTGTYIVQLKDQDNSRHIAKSYNITSANTWQYVSITYDGDTTGSLDNDNAESLGLQFFLAAGSNFTSGTLDTSWATTTTANSAVGQVNLADAVGNEWYITGVQFEVGEVATPFEQESFAETLRKCQRYYHKINSATGNGNYLRYNLQRNTSSTGTAGSYHMPVTMRSTPSVETTGTESNYAIANVTGGNTACSSTPAIGGDGSGPDLVNLEASVASGLTSGQASQLMSNNNKTSYIAFSAEL